MIFCRACSGWKHSTLVGALVLALLATACQSGALAEPPPATRVFRIGTAPLASLDPVLASEPQERLVAKQLFDGLVRYDDTTAAVVPNVATSWDINPSNTVFTFHLRPKSRFSSGEYVTAESFVRGFTRALTPDIYHAAGSLGYELDGIAGAADVVSGKASTLAGVRALGDATLEIRLSAPDAQFLVHCADVAFSPMPNDVVVAGRLPSWGAFPLGNGPFQLSGPLEAGQPIVLVPNVLHAGGHPKVAQVAFRPYEDVGASYAAWRAGQLDWTAFPPEKTGEVRHIYRSSSLIRPTAGLDALVLPLTVAPTDNLAFRQALSLAIDRTKIGLYPMGNSLLPANGLVPPLIPGSGSGAASSSGPTSAAPCSSCTYDPARARRLLAQSGVKIAGVFPLYYAQGTGQEAWVRAAAGDISAVLGIDARAMPLPASAGGSPGATAIALPMRYPTPDDFLTSLVGSGGRDNSSGYANPALDTLVATAPSIADAGLRAARYQQAERLALADLPVVPLFWQRSFRLARLKGWKGLGMDAFGDPTLASLAPT
jgi:oligopeptide transport system substrate-binding protein